MSQPDENARIGQTGNGDESAAPASSPYGTSAYPTAEYSGPPQSQAYPAPELQDPSYAGPYPAQGGYQTPGYPSPGYPASGQAAPGYPAHGYPPNPVYGAPYGYPPYGYGGPRGPVRPGAATASAVLMFIQAAVVLISTLYVLFFASLASGLNSYGVGSNSLETELTIIGVLQLVSVGLLIFAGVQLVGGNTNGRPLTMIACGAQLGLTVYWMVRISSLPDFNTDGSTFFFVVPLMYAVLPVVGLALGVGKPVTDYIAAKSGVRSPSA